MSIAATPLDVRLTVPLEVPLLEILTRNVRTGRRSSPWPRRGRVSCTVVACGLEARGPLVPTC